MLSRRAFLGGAVGVAGLAGGALVVPGVHDRLFGPPDPPHPLPAVAAGRVVEGSFPSAAMRRRVKVLVAYPGDVVEGLPVLLQLHGRDDQPSNAFRSHHLDVYLADAVRRGVPPFAVVAPEGGKHSYWHQRADGTDPQRMLVDELLPLLADHGLRTDRIAVGGWSMGGYGALLLAETLGPARVAACVPDSPALFRDDKDYATGSFDSAADFDAHDVVARSGRLAGIPTRVSCGTSDPFIGEVRELLRRGPQIEHLLGPGGHNAAWWQHAAPSQLAFAGRHLAQVAT